LYRDNTIQIGTTESPASRTSESEARRVDTRSISVTEFEITCYLANYEERDTR